MGPALGGIGDRLSDRQGESRCRRCSKVLEHQQGTHRRLGPPPLNAASQPGSPALHWFPYNESATHPGSGRSSPGRADQMACDRGTVTACDPVPRPGVDCGRWRPPWSSRRSHRAVTVGGSPPTECSHGHSAPGRLQAMGRSTSSIAGCGTKKQTEACRAPKTSSARRSIDRARPSTGRSADRAGPNRRQTPTGRGPSDDLASRP